MLMLGCQAWEQKTKEAEVRIYDLGYKDSGIQEDRDHHVGLRPPHDGYIRDTLLVIVILQIPNFEKWF
jgi:hypothetical protein